MLKFVILMHMYLDNIFFKELYHCIFFLVQKQQIINEFLQLQIIITKIHNKEPIFLRKKKRKLN